MVIKALLDASIAGVGALHRTSIFPCSIFQVGEGINLNEGDPNYDLFRLALESTAKRLYPNYANCNVSTQKEWVKFDRDSKTEILNNLTNEEQEKLIQILLDNPELQNLLMIDVIKEEE